MKIEKQQFIQSLSKETLESLYEYNSAIEAAELYSVSYKWIISALDYYNIKHKTRSEITKLSTTQNKLKQTCVKKYGVTNVFNRPDVRKNSSAPEARSRAAYATKMNNLEKYGVASTNKLVSVREKLSKASKEHWENFHDTRLEKARQTCVEKYGVDSYAKSVQFKEFYAENVQSFKEKEFKTKLKNNSFTSSNPEEIAYKYLCDKYGECDIMRQYKDKKYPYHCDFYIRSLDLYIELNAHWTHGGHPFDKDNEEDIKKLELWKEKAKTSKFYERAVYVWTQLDVNKLNIAKKNNLNFIAYYNDINNLYKIYRKDGN